MTLFEPTTLFTDLFVAAVAAPLAWRLRRREVPAARWWTLALALSAAGAVIGGTQHGFAPNFSYVVADRWWKLALFTISAVAAAMSMSLVLEISGPAQRRFWRGTVAGKFVIFVFLLLRDPRFIVVMVDYGLVLVAWGIAALAVQRPWRGWVLAGVTLCFVAAAVQQMKWGLSSSFNHNDVFHLIQALAVVMFYKAGEEFGYASDGVRAR